MVGWGGAGAGESSLCMRESVSQQSVSPLFEKGVFFFSFFIAYEVKK